MRELKPQGRQILVAEFGDDLQGHAAFADIEDDAAILFAQVRAREQNPFAKMGAAIGGGVDRAEMKCAGHGHGYFRMLRERAAKKIWCICMSDVSKRQTPGDSSAAWGRFAAGDRSFGQRRRRETGAMWMPSHRASCRREF
jgi:hypothetical protein